MRANNACSWKGCRVHKTNGTIQINMETPKLFLCDNHCPIYKKLLRSKLTFGKIQKKRYLKNAGR